MGKNGTAIGTYLSCDLVSWVGAGMLPFTGTQPRAVFGRFDPLAVASGCLTATTSPPVCASA
jgi:hypothetical protein